MSAITETYNEIDLATLNKGSTTFTSDAPVFILNLLRFRKQAIYDRAVEGPTSPCSGYEAYITRYVPAFGVVSKAQAEAKTRPLPEVTYLAASVAGLCGPPHEHWDTIVLVKYPNFSAFRELYESPEYKSKADPHRLAAVEDTRLIASTQASFG